MLENMYITSVRIDDMPPEDKYISGIPAVRSLTEAPIVFDKPVTFFVGENGSGKSTVLEAIAVKYGFNPEGGGRQFSFSTADTHSELSGYIVLSKKYRPKDGFFLRAESMYNFFTNMEERAKEDGLAYKAYGGRSLHTRSHGESFTEILKTRFVGQGLYILDEPEAALSASKQLAMMCIMDGLVKSDSQFIIATHSPILTGFPDAAIYEFSDDGIERTEYESTDNYQLTKRFLCDRERYLKLLLEG